MDNVCCMAGQYPRDRGFESNTKIALKIKCQNNKLVMKIISK